MVCAAGSCADHEADFVLTLRELPPITLRFV